MFFDSLFLIMAVKKFNYEIMVIITEFSRKNWIWILSYK